MATLKKWTLIRVKETGGAFRKIGRVKERLFLAFPRREDEHLFRGGCDDVNEARENGKAAWGLDLAAMESLAADYGVELVEIPSDRRRYRAKMETVLGPKSFVMEFGMHRPQAMLNLEYWTEMAAK